MNASPEAPGESSRIRIVEANLDLEEHQKAVVEMVNAYSMDEMGNSAPLASDVRGRLISGLRNHPTTMAFLAYEGEQPIGIAVCFLGFSTFAARPLINIHDLSVIPGRRGIGVGRSLLDAVAEKGRKLGCCKLTLEVLEYNHRAKGLYEAVGFKQADYLEGAGGALFYTRSLNDADAGVPPD